jgi:hypothetical protein
MSQGTLVGKLTACEPDKWFYLLTGTGIILLTPNLSPALRSIVILKVWLGKVAVTSRAYHSPASVTKANSALPLVHKYSQCGDYVIRTLLSKG